MLGRGTGLVQQLEGASRPARLDGQQAFTVTSEPVHGSRLGRSRCDGLRERRKSSVVGHGRRPWVCGALAPDRRVTLSAVCCMDGRPLTFPPFGG